MICHSYKKRAKYYDIEYMPLNDIPFLNRFINDNLNSILEIPCGSGHHLQWLLMTKKRIFLIDKEIEMLRLINKKLLDYEKNQNITLINDSLENFKLPEKVDLIIIPQESFQFLLEEKDIIATLSNIYYSLSRAGIAIIDLATFCTQINAEKNNSPRYWFPDRIRRVKYYDWTRKIDANLNLLRYSSFYDTDDLVSYTFFYQIRNKSNRILEYYKSEITLRKHKVENLSKLLLKIGFIIQNIYGDYNLRDFELKHQRMIYILKKNEN